MKYACYFDTKRFKVFSQPSILNLGDCLIAVIHRKILQSFEQKVFIKIFLELYDFILYNYNFTPRNIYLDKVGKNQTILHLNILPNI